MPLLANLANAIQEHLMLILRMPAVKAETGHRSHASIYNAIKAGLFTKPVQIGQRSVGWPASEVEAINAARIAGNSDDEIRELVKWLHARRRSIFTVGGAA
jgi:prophage regulatory protein